MKKTFITAIIGLAMCTTVSAQKEIYGRSVRLGFKLDPVFSNSLKPFDNGVEKDGGKFGLNYGLMTDIMFSDGRGAFATGLEVNHTGGKFKTTNGGLYGPGSYDLKLQYLQIPLSVKLKTNPVNNFRWWGQFGTYLDALIGARLDYNATTSGTNERIMSSTNKVNMGLLIGAGGEYNLGYKTDLYFGLGFENGFTDVTSNGKWHDGKVALNRWALRFGVFF